MKSHEHALKVQSQLLRFIVAGFLLTVFAICATGQSGDATRPSTNLLRCDPVVDRLVSPQAKVEKIAGNLKRSEGPLWISNGGYLLFDLNEIIEWTPAEGLSVSHGQTSIRTCTRRRARRHE